MPGGNRSPAVERHLKKIYDCLNIGCNKKAVQEVDRLPKNVRDLTVFKALKALALIRIYKRRQAFDILNEINPEDDLDEVTLQTMTSCYKESVDVGKIVDLYEAASKRKPNDPDVMAHLFMAHVRMFNFKRQKDIALQSYKLFSKKNRLYYFWAIMSFVMQAQEVEDEKESTDKKVFLSLAEKMCERMIEDERTNEEIELYLTILRKQNKYEEEYRFLTGPVCLRLTDHLSWFNRRRAYLCLDLKMYSRAFKHYFPTLIQEYPDQIEYYQGLFKSAFLLDTEASSQQQPVAVCDQQQAAPSPNQTAGNPVKSMSALTECYDIVEKQCVLALEPTDPKSKAAATGAGAKNLSRTSSLNPNRHRLLRGPFMARIELYNTILANESILPPNVFNSCKAQFATNYPTLNSLLLDYFQAFSRKIICHYDLDHMISSIQLSNPNKDKLVDSVREWVEDLHKNQPDMSPYDTFHVVLNYHMLKHSLFNYKTSDTREERLKKAKMFIDLYDENRHLGKNANKTEFQPVDHYILLAINSIMTNAISLNESTCVSGDPASILSDSVILSLLVLAENAVTNSPSNHQLNLILLKLYSFIGASKRCSDVLLSLDIKHFMIDTLGHLLNPVLYNTGNYSLSKESLETCSEFYALGIRECFEGLTASYRDGRFSKIEEISRVLRRLRDSLNATQCILLKGVVANLNASSQDELLAASQSFDPFKGLHRLFSNSADGQTETIKDSRDFKVLKSLNAETNELIQRRQLETLDDEKVWLKLRYHLTRSIYVQFEHSNRPQNKGDDASSLEELSLSRREVADLRLRIDSRLKESSNDDRYSYLEPEASPFRWSHINLNTLIDLVTPLVFLEDSQKLTAEMQDEYYKKLDAIIGDLENKLNSIDSLTSMKKGLLSLTISVEFISLCVTSLCSLSYLDSSSYSGVANSSVQVATGKSGSSSNQPTSQSTTVGGKSKSMASQMMGRTEAQLMRLSNAIKTFDPKTTILDKITRVEEILVSDAKHARVDTKADHPLIAVMSKEFVQTSFVAVKEKLVESYGESLREIEQICRRKLKLCRSF